MSDEYIRLDTTIIGIDSLINKTSTAEEAKVLFTAKDVIYSQQRYVTEAQPVKRGKWSKQGLKRDGFGGFTVGFICSACKEFVPFKGNYCPNCGARMDLEDGDTDG